MTRLVLLIAALLALAPAVAHAATYEVWSCAGPDGAPVAADGWAFSRYGPSQAVDECASGAGLLGYLDGRAAQPAETRAAWTFEAPKDTTIAGARIWRGARAGPRVGSTVTAYTMTFGRDVEGTGPQVEFCNADLDVPCSALGSGPPLGEGTLVSRTDLEKGVRWLTLEAVCTGGTADPCPATGAPEVVAFRMFRAAIRLNDTGLPAFVTPLSGSLTAPVPLTGPQSIAFSATDTGSGLQKAVLEVDGQPAVTKELGCAPPYTAVVPCKLDSSGTLDLDTATLADGAHTVRVLVSDATGENTVASAPISITTANTPSSCASVESPSFAVAFDRKRATIAYGGRLSVRGSLGAVPAGTQVSVYSLIDRAGAAPRFGRTPLTTDAAGRFTYRVPAGPSRTLRFAARIPGQLAYSCSKPLKVAVRASVSLKGSPRSIRSGQRVRFSGRLLRGYVPANGKVVELQAFERGVWRTFRTVRSNAKGAFSYRYRFSFRAKGTTFPVRARVRADGSYPFALGTSKRVRVRVR